MRLTINLDDDLYAMARAHAILKRISLSKAVGDLLRSRVTGNGSGDRPDAGLGGDFHIDPETPLPVVRGDGRALTMAGIRRAMDDDDARLMEAAGWIKPGDPIP